MSHPELNGTFDEEREIAELAALVGMERGGPPADRIDATEGGPVHLIPPPDAVWARIAASTGVRVEARAVEVRRTADTVPVTELARELTAVPVAPTVQRHSDRPVTVIGPRRPGRDRRTESLLTLVAAAMLVIGLVGGAGTVLAMNRWGDPDPGTVTAAASVLSRAALTGLPDAPTAAGDVDMVKTPSGMQLQVSVRRLARADGYYEVWLADRSVKQMIPVGLMQGDTATFDLPPDVDPAGYPTVDISLEPLDGNPAHSARSVLRGTLG